MKPNKVIGLTGTIASGKSSAAQYLKETYQIPCIDADQVGHEVLKEEAVIRQLCTAFGEGILAEDGSVSRKALGELVFADQEKLAALNQITHPVICSHIEEWTETCQTEAPFVLIEAYGLLQSDLKNLVEEVWVVGCDKNLRVSRVMERQHLSLEQAQARVAGQWLDEKYREAADVYLDGSGSLAFLQAQCDQIMKRYRIIQ